MKMFRALALIGLLTPAVSVVAQEKSPGYIITVKGDSIRGFIVESADVDMARKAEISSGETEPTTVYASGDLAEVVFDRGRKFKRFDVPNPESKGRDSVAILAKLMLTGQISAWVWKGPRDQPDFFLTNNSTRQTVHLVQPEKTTTTF